MFINTRIGSYDKLRHALEKLFTKRVKNLGCQQKF